MKNPKQPLIPATGKTAQPAQEPQGPSITDWMGEGHARLRRINGDQVHMATLIDKLMNEILIRDQANAELTAKLAKFDPA